MAQINDLRVGMIIDFKNGLYVVTHCDHVKPGKGSAFARCKMKNIRTGSVLENTWKASETVDPVRVERRKMQYLYSDGAFLSLMDVASYEQYNYNVSDAKDIMLFLKENLEVEALLYESEIIGIELPFFVELKVVETEPGIKGDTATNATKPAVMETGLTINVPLFVNQDEVLKIDTRTSEYIERVRK